MAETTAEVRRDIEITRERMSDTLAQLEHKLNVMQVVRDHPWPAIAVAAGAGFALANSRADVKAAAAAVKATGGASSKVGALLDDLAASVIGGVSAALSERVDNLVGELKAAIGAPTDGRSARHSLSDQRLATYSEATARANTDGFDVGVRPGGPRAD
jgi:membrane protein involved in colicin uptake